MGLGGGVGGLVLSFAGGVGVETALPFPLMSRRVRVVSAFVARLCVGEWEVSVLASCVGWVAGVACVAASA